jgi:hypothetical protein
MVRGLAFLLLLLDVGFFGCSKSPDAHSESIPEIPKGRPSVGREAGEQFPVAPPAKPRSK